MHIVSGLDQLRRLWRHAAWSDVLMLEALQMATRAPDEAVREYLHVVGAEEVWLARIERRPSRAAVWPTMSLHEVSALGESVRDGYHRLLADMEPDALDEPIRYTNSAGQEFTTAVGDILLHVALHGQYHRGKINLLLRQAGEGPAPVDFISFVRGVPAATHRTGTGAGAASGSSAPLGAGEVARP